VTSPWPGIVAGVDVSFERVADLKTHTDPPDEKMRQRHPMLWGTQQPGPKLYRRLRRNPPDPSDPMIQSPREVARIAAGIYSD